MSHVKILHLVQRDGVFIDFFRARLREVNKSVDYVLIEEDHIDGSGVAGLHSLKDRLAWCDVLLVHYLSPLGVRLILECPAEKVVFWSGWGGDYVELIGSKEASFSLATQELLSSVRLQRKRNLSAKARLKSIVRYARRIKERAAKFRAIGRVDFFSSPIISDYWRLRNRLGDVAFPARFLQINYGGEQDYMAPNSHEQGAKYVLVGNSATPANNHVDVFRLLSTAELDATTKIIVPLSYGDVRYRAEVMRLGDETFGERFLPLLEPVPLRHYNAILASCSIAVMNHRVQQGLGNINTLLMNGAKLFLSRCSPIYELLKQEGAFVFSVDSGFEADSFLPLNQAQIEKNVEVVRRFWGDDVVQRNFFAAIDELSNLVSERVSERNL